MKSDETIQEVNERWRLRDGRYVIITHRCGTFSSGHLEGTISTLSWGSGRCASGERYDLVEMVGEPEANR